MIGQTFGHYRIVAKIGAGGMGEVYRAHDRRLDRDVALKVLPTGTLSDEVARKHFHKEALTLSKLNHPNIATVYDFDSQGGVDFLAMEHVDGQTLAQVIAGRPLPEKEVIRLGGQIAEALEEAHEHGVIHRDLKPANIMLTSKGRVKVLDFGLARLLRPRSEEARTEDQIETGVLAGTLPYMAPEQLRGEAADARTDIYAAGALLYEMATGARPFPRTLPTLLVDDVFHKAPPPPGRLQPDLSPQLEAIILKCLDKEPDNRYQSAKELLVDLRRLSGGPNTVVGPRMFHLQKRVSKLAALLLIAGALATAYLASRRFWPQSAASKRIMLAVLPFENLSDDPKQEYFSDGLTEEMISQLGRWQPRRLGVIARTSATHYKGSKSALTRSGANWPWPTFWRAVSVATKAASESPRNLFTWPIRLLFGQRPMTVTPPMYLQFRAKSPAASPSPWHSNCSPLSKLRYFAPRPTIQPRTKPISKASII